MVSTMSDDDKKATEGTGEKATNGAAKATSAADETDTLKHAGGSESDAWDKYIGLQALASIRPYIGDEEKKTKLRAIVTAGMTGIAPRDKVEGMIAAQMLAIHDTAMACFRYAMGANKTSGLFRDYLNQAGKLSRTFAMLLDALNRHHGKGPQKITVEHVHVHSGGQAVVGIVEAPGGGVQARLARAPQCGLRCIYGGDALRCYR
jgi:hypothetical protein